MFRFRVRKNTGLLLKFTQTAVLFQDTSIFFSLEIELSLSSGSYFFFRKLLFHFTFFFADGSADSLRPWMALVIYIFYAVFSKSQIILGGRNVLMSHQFLERF